VSPDLRLPKELNISEVRRFTTIRANCAEIDVPASPASDMVYRGRGASADLALPIGTLKDTLENPGQDHPLTAGESTPDQPPKVFAKCNLPF
jgi:hypothetical protein